MAEGDRRRFLIEIVGDTDDAVKAMQQVSAGMADVSKAAQQSGASFFQTAAIVAAGTAAMTRGVQVTVGAAADLELQIDRVNDVIDLTGASTKLMAENFLLAGLNAGDLIGAAAEFAKIGAGGQEQLEGLAEAAFKFGTVTEQSATSAARSISAFALALGTPIDQIENLSSSLLFLSEQTGVSADSMQRYVSILGQAGLQAGFTSTEILGLSAGLAQLGFLGRKAIPGLLSLFDLMEERPGRIARVLGVTRESLEGMARGEQLVNLLKKLKEVEVSGGKTKTVFKKLGIESKFAQAAMLQLASRTDKLTQAMDFASTGFQDVGALQAEFEQRTGTLRAQLSLLSTQFEAIFTRIGSFLVPFFTLAVQVMRVFLGVISLIPTPVMALGSLLFGLAAGVLLLANGMVFLGKVFGGAIANLKVMHQWATVAIFDTMREFVARRFLARGYGEQLAFMEATNLSKIALIKQSLIELKLLFRETLARARVGAMIAWNTALRLREAAAQKLQALRNFNLAKGLEMLKGAQTAVAAGFSSMAAGAAKMLVALGPVGAIIAVVVAAILAAVLLVPKLIKMFDSGSASAKAFALVLMGIFWPLVGLFITLKVAVAILKGIFEGLFDVISSALSAVVEPFVILFEAIFGAFGKTLSLGKMLSAVMSAITTVVAFLVKFAFWPLLLVFKAIGFVLRLLMAGFGFFVDILAGILQPAVEALSTAWDTLVGAFKPIIDLFTGGEKGAGLMAGAMGFLVGAVKVVAKALGWLLAVVLWPIIVAVKLISLAIQGLASVFKFLAGAVSKAVSIITLGLFGSSMFHIAEGIDVIMAPLKLLISVFESIGKVVSGVASIVGKFFSMFGGGGGADVSLSKSLAVDNSGGGMMGFLSGADPMPVIVRSEPEREAVSRAATRMAGGATIRLVSQLVLDGSVIAEAIQEYKDVNRMRHFNDPDLSMRGVT